jgi:acyl-CoA synthetase (NDP forming)
VTRASTGSLAALFNPWSVAVVGASPRDGYALTTIQNLRSMGYRGSIYPINPAYRQVAGLRCYPSLEAVPDWIQTVVVAVPAARVPAVIESAAAVRSEVAIVYASGLGEGPDHAGVEWAEAVRHTARENGLRVVGPNCLGTIDLAEGCALWPVVLPSAGLRASRGVGLVAQSGNMPLTVLSTGRGVRFTKIVSCGNQLDVTATELIEQLLSAPDVSVVAAMLEGVPDLDRFSAVLARAADQDVPVVVLRAGRTRLGRVATLAHTGSLSGPDHLMRALLRHHGAVDVHDLDELLATCAVLTSGRRLRGVGVGALSTSGGECALLADLATEQGLELPPLPAASAAELAGRLPPFITPTNPLDVTAATWGDAAVYRSAVVALAGAPGVDVVVHLGDRPAHAPADDGAWRRILEGLAAGAAETSRPVVSIATVGDVRSEHMAELEDLGVVPLAGLRPALAALAYAARREQAMAALERRRPGGTVVDTARQKRARRLLDRGPAELAEATAKGLVALYGIPTPPGSVVTSATAAETQARQLGFPVAMKLHGPGLAHKSDIGGVLLGVADAAQAKAAFVELSERGRRAGFEEAMVLVEQQVEGGVELIVGGRNDPQFGPVLMVGAGGVLTELLQDTAHRLAPIDRQEALEMMAELRSRTMLDGHRGRPGIDREAVADVLVAMSDLLTELPQVRELDLNPILPGPGGRGCVAVDALAVLARPEVEPG